MLAHVSNNNHCVLLTRPAFSRQDNQIFRQIGRMFVDAEDDLAVTIAWQGGKNSSGTVQIPPATIRYFFQTSKEPGTDTICVASPLGTYDSLLFIEHPFYLPRWMDGYFNMLAQSDERVVPYFGFGPAVEQEQQTQPSSEEENNAQIPQQQQPAVPSKPKNSRSVAALKTDTITALVKVGTKWSATKKQPKCDIEGINCEEVPTFARLGAAQPSRCVQHRVPDMVTKEPVPLLTSVSSSAAQKQTGSSKKKSLVKQVQFNEPSDEGKEYDILQTSKTAVDTSALGMSCGDLFGQPQTSPVKPDICREKSCKKKATFTLETEDDDSIGVLCAEHAKAIPGAYKVKGIL